MEGTKYATPHKGLVINIILLLRGIDFFFQYDRIDPSDVQALRDEIDDLQIDIRKFEEAQAIHVKEMEDKDKLVSVEIKL